MTLIRVFLLCLLTCVAPLQAQAQADACREYANGARDSLKIAVFQSREHSLELRVNKSGTISFPLLGQVQIGGLSATPTEKAIADGLRVGNFLKQSQVIIVIN
jgi:polysaccharide export outer membrane protein